MVVLRERRGKLRQWRAENYFAKHDPKHWWCSFAFSTLRHAPALLRGLTSHQSSSRGVAPISQHNPQNSYVPPPLFFFWINDSRTRLTVSIAKLYKVVDIGTPPPSSANASSLLMSCRASSHLPAFPQLGSIDRRIRTRVGKLSCMRRFTRCLLVQG